MPFRVTKPGGGTISRDEADDDDDFIKLSSLLGRGTLCGYEYKSHTAADSTLLMAVGIRLKIV